MKESIKMTIALGLYIFTIIAFSSKVRTLRKSLLQKDNEIKEIESRLELLEKVTKSQSDSKSNE